MANTYKPVIERDMSVYQKAPLPWAPGTQALTYDVRSDQDVPAVTADPAMYDQYAQLVQKAYENLRRAGREQDASALKNAADKFSATGSQLGLNSFSRAAALRGLQNQMNISANLREAGLSQAEMQALAAATAGKASQSAQAFQQAMARAQFREDKLASMKQDELANSQLRLQQRALLANQPRRLPTPSLAGTAMALRKQTTPTQNSAQRFLMPEKVAGGPYSSGHTNLVWKTASGLPAPLASQPIVSRGGSKIRKLTGAFGSQRQFA